MDRLHGNRNAFAPPRTSLALCAVATFIAFVVSATLTTGVMHLFARRTDHTMAPSAQTRTTALRSSQFAVRSSQFAGVSCSECLAPAIRG